MTSLYDVHTVLEIPYHPISVTDAISPSNIAASHSTQQDLAVAANKDLTIITNNSTDVETINFDCSIDAIVWSKNGEYLVAAGSDGKLAILRKDDCKVIFSENILTDHVNGAHCSTDRVFITLSITEMDKKGIYCIGAPLVSGKVIVLEQLDLSRCFIDFKINKTNIKQSFIDPTRHHTSLKGLLCIHMGQKINFLTLGHGGDFMVQWCKQEPFFSKDEEKGYRDVDFVDHEVIRGVPNNLHCDGFEKCTVAGTMLFALDNLGHLYQLSW
uniref:KNTC1 N-terminal domain-containing protein n=1 Tax=Ciona savignyi TaxID=51511 RepID=H2ZCQ5_CIOSA